jgi:1-deoxy-D-xylulose-5-phosphate reductoisomerase
MADSGQRHITILGSTGSIGCSTLDLIARTPEGYVVEALTANRNVPMLIEQAKRFRPKLAVVADEKTYNELKNGLRGTGIEVAAGKAALVEAAQRPANWVMAGVVGAAGLAPTLAAVRRGACVALANKECLVCAGEIFLREVRDANATLLPVDSEHNAVFQVFDWDRLDAVRRIILTASGGPFRQWTREDMAQATPEQAIAHPNWEMGAKISVDSATLMNKGLELIEAHYLFPVGREKLDVVVHPQSVIHSMVEYVDGSVLAQLGSPDMRTPIAYTLAWPARMEAPSPRLDFAKIGSLTFEEPDFRRFPALNLARHALQTGGAAPTILNAANEVAVGGFLNRRIGFLDIADTVEHTLDAVLKEWGKTSLESLQEVHEVDRRARQVADERITGMVGA